MKNKICIAILMLLFVFIFTACKDESVSYHVQIIDIDQEVIGDKTITSDGKNILKDLQDNFEVVSAQSDYGTYLISINKSIVDPNYFLAIYQNDEMAQTGIDSITCKDGDRLVFKNTCFADNFTSTDLLVDQIIYRFMKKHAKGLFEKQNEFYDYYLTSAVYSMIIEGYDQNIFNFDFANVENIKENINKKDWNNLSNINDLMKGFITSLALNISTDNLKNALNENTNWNEWLLIPSKYLEINNDSFNDYLNSLKPDNAAGDYALMLLLPKDLYIDCGIENIKSTYANATEDGIDSYGVNSASTALFVIALLASGEKLSDYQVNNKNMLDSLLEYELDGAFKWMKSDEKVDLNFSTPQAITALITYKIIRDRGYSSYNIFSFGK